MVILTVLCVCMCVCVSRRKSKRVSSVMEGGHEVLKRESMGCRFKGELKALVERIHSTEVNQFCCGHDNCTTAVT